MFVIHSTQKGFVHIPRTAGSFIESQCQHLDGFEMLHPYHGDIPKELSHYEWHTRVRDPVERFVSIFRANQSNKRLSTHTGDFNSFIEHVWNQFEMHTRPQASYINEFTHCYLDIVDCVNALGGEITGEKINQSTEDMPMVFAEQITQIKQIYSQDVELISRLKNCNLENKKG